MIKGYVKQLSLKDNEIAARLFTENNRDIKRLEKKLGVEIDTRGTLVTFHGEEEKTNLAKRLIEELYNLIERGYQIQYPDIDYAIRMLSDDKRSNLCEVFLDRIHISFKNKTISPKSSAQKRYVDIMRRYDIVFCIGPAGTGKTYLAMAMAIASLQKKEVGRIILTRPAVEAGENLGFLPGDMFAKVDPYLRPLYDALYDMMDFENVQRLMERNVIEVAPLAFMRGRTLNDSFVILDEAQNTTSEQMKMFLTRLGMGSKAVITGDITQIDLPLARPSGMVDAQSILKGVEGIEFVYFSEKDVVRHPLVQEIIKAYER